MARIRPQMDYAGFESADAIIEAVFEDMEIKKQIFAEIDLRSGGRLRCRNEHCSTLNIDEIASATSRPCVGGRHAFFQSRECDAAGGNRTGEGNVE